MSTLFEPTRAAAYPATGSERTRRARNLRARKKALLAAAAMACAAAPALAYGGADGGRSFIAVDYAWQANGTSATTLTIAPGQTVTFGYPTGTEPTTSTSRASRPRTCPGLPPGPAEQGWSGDVHVRRRRHLPVRLRLPPAR